MTQSFTLSPPTPSHFFSPTDQPDFRACGNASATMFLVDLFGSGPEPAPRHVQSFTPSSQMGGRCSTSRRKVDEGPLFPAHRHPGLATERIVRGWGGSLYHKSRPFSSTVGYLRRWNSPSCLDIGKHSLGTFDLCPQSPFLRSLAAGRGRSSRSDGLVDGQRVNGFMTRHAL